MLYLNQREYRHIKYYHNASNGGPGERDNVATSGCGLCSACMIIDHLTMESLSIEDCVKLSETSGANHSMGTDMTILGEEICKRYNLEMTTTTDRDEMIKHLQSGGEIIAHVGSKTPNTPSLFTNRGHYITIISVDNDEVCILDPSYTPTKFDVDHRRGKVRICEPFIYCPIDTMMGEIKKKGFYMFKRKDR